MAQEYSPQALKAKLMTMMVLRVVLALAFLGVTSWVQVSESPLSRLNFHPIYAIVVVVSLLTILYARTLSRVKNLRLFTYLQVTVDIFLITGIVYVTGGIESYLQIMYLLTVMGSSILLSRRGGYYAASISSIAYGTLVDMDFYGMLPVKYMVFGAETAHAWKDVLTTVSTNMLAFFTVAYLTGYLAESTARVEKRLEEKEIDFEKLERLNRNIVENISSGIMTLDAEERITSFNNAAENMTGYSLKEVYYKKAESLFPGLMDDVRDRDRAGIRLERVFSKKDAEELHLGFTVSQGQGGEAAYIVIFQDLTKLKVMEDQLRRAEKLRALGELSVGIAHEVRNPLASISGSIQVLKEDLSLGSDDARLMEIVVRETDRLNTLISDFLLFARPAHEQRQIVSLDEVVAEKIDIFKHSPEAAGIKIEANLTEGLLIEADPRQIGQVLLNLFLNSAQAMRWVGEGGAGGKGGTLTVTASICTGGYKGAWHGREDSGEGGEVRAQQELYPYAEVMVRDTGCGISEEDLARIFDPFFSTKDLGTGLGLAIAHRIIESHGR
jgi:two-component system sensor histidine kinase PilS (NtrC family)